MNLFLRLLVPFLIPFLIAGIAAALIVVMKRQKNIPVKRLITGFAAGILAAAAVWFVLTLALGKQSFLNWGFFPLAAGLSFCFFKVM